MVEVLSVVILTLVMTRLKLDQSDPRQFEDALRDGTLALACGMGFTLLLWTVLSHPLDLRLTEYFAQNSVEIAHGRNIVNVILVDFRALDTLGEIAVVLGAGISILLLLRPQMRKAAIPSDKPIRPARARKPRAKAGKA
jgi:multicomponent Na+:H+ antiporter subunit A